MLPVFCSVYAGFGTLICMQMYANIYKNQMQMYAKTIANVCKSRASL